MQKKSIYVAYTGGTIGMQRSEQGYIPVSGHLQRQLALMPEFHRPEMPDFTIHEYTPLMDSSDMTPEDWQHIAEDIKAHYDDYDGFVILHGTDTMAYTASALSFMLENLGKPVIVTGSQIPLAELRSDGQINLLNALYVAANYPINEVTLFFNNRPAVVIAENVAVVELSVQPNAFSCARIKPPTALLQQTSKPNATMANIDECQRQSGKRSSRAPQCGFVICSMR